MGRIQIPSLVTVRARERVWFALMTIVMVLVLTNRTVAARCLLSQWGEAKGSVDSLVIIEEELWRKKHLRR